MIKFEGEHSQECAKFICKVHQKYSFLTALFPLVLVEIPVFIMSFSHFSWHWGITLLLNLVGWSLVNFVITRPPSKSSYDIMMPTSVVILDDGTIVSKGKKFEYKQHVEHVSQVVDHGAFYELFFNTRPLRAHFVCEKALLTYGTLDDFEALFEGKIILE